MYEAVLKKYLHIEQRETVIEMSKYLNTTIPENH